MKDLQRLVAACIADLDTVGIRPGMVEQWSVNTRAKCRWGLCTRLPSGAFRISIAERLLQDDVCDQAAKDTIVHELLHTVRGCHDHGKHWKSLAQRVNTLLPQYRIQRTATYEEKGLSPALQEHVSRYAVRCASCGKIYARERNSKLIQHPEAYRCGLCHGRLERADQKK